MKDLLTELFNQYYKDVYTYLYSMSQNPSLSEDLASEVFVEVVKSIAAFRGESDIKTWLFAIARHKWFAHLRKEKNYPQTENLFDLSESPFLATDDFSSSSDLEQMVNTLLASENEMTKKVFRLRVAGYSYYEIGEQLGISENSARVVFFRVKAKIKKTLEKEGFSHD